MQAWSAFLINSTLCLILWLMFSMQWVTWCRFALCLMATSRFHSTTLPAFPPEVVYDNSSWVFRTCAWCCCLSHRLLGMKAFSDLLLLVIGYLRCHGVTFIKAFEAELSQRELAVLSGNLLWGKHVSIVVVFAWSVNFSQACRQST